MIDALELPDPHKFMTTNLVWDLIEHSDVHRVLPMFGLIPPGPDGQAMACEDSHIRMMLVEPVVPHIEYLAAKISTILMTAILEDATTEIDDELRESLVAQQEQFIGVGAKVIIAHLIAAQVLTYKGLETS